MALCALAFSLPAPGGKGERLPWSARHRDHFELKDAELRDVVKRISALTGKNIVVSDKVRGKITIHGPTKVNRKEAWRAFLDALTLNDLTIFKQGKWWRIVPMAEGRGEPTPIYDSRGAP